MKNIKYILIILISIALASCKKTTLPAEDLGEDYFPLETGRWIEYQIDSIVYDDFFTPVKIDTFKLKAKFELGESYKNAEGKLNYRWIKYTKNDTTDYEVSDVFAVNTSTFGYKFLINNNWYLKFAFPLKLGKQWDVNSYNTKDELLATYVDVEHLHSVNMQTYDTCVSIIFEDFESLISNDYHFEIYSKHIGMIYKNIKHIKTEISGEITAGYTLEYKILDYGN